MKQLLTRCLVTIVLLLSAGLSGVRAYPISPATLWELVERAELVVYAEVVSSDSLDAKGDEDDVWHTHAARLRVLETWKGSGGVQPVVRFAGNMICPAPARYVEGKRVVAFLARGDGYWLTVGLSYGTLYPAEDEVAVHRTLVGRAVRLQSRAPVNENLRLDWLVAAAAHRGTRWHGLYPLERGSDPLHQYYDRSADQRPWSQMLGTRHLERLAAGFVAEPSLDRTLPMMLEVLAGHPDDEVDRVATAAVETLLKREHVPWWIGQALEQLFRRYGDSRATDRVAPLGGLFEKRDSDAVRLLWREAKQELQIPDTEPLPEREVEVRGVGSNTPS